MEERPPIPVITYALTAINVLVFLLMLRAGHGDVSNVAEMFGAKVNSLIQQGQWWRFLTPVFLHGSLIHIISNSLSLVWFGSSIERLYGPRKYLLIYLLAGIAGNIASYIHMPGLSLGASGAIFGLIGAGLTFPIRFRSLLPKEAPQQILGQILPIAAINLYIGFTLPGIDNWAHMGGLAGGAIVALFLLPDALTERDPHPAQNALLSLACLGMIVVTLLAGFKQWQWAKHDLPMDTYEVGTKSDAWWSLGIPTGWRASTQGLAWSSPDGGALRILDNSEDPQLPEELHAVSGQAKPNLSVDGHPAWHIQAKIGAGTSDLYLVSVYDRVVAFIFQPPATPSRQYTNAVSQILRSVRFNHAPAPLPPAPVAPVQ